MFSKFNLFSMLDVDGTKYIPGFGYCIFKKELDLIKILRIIVRKSFGSDVIYGDIAVLSESDFSRIEAKRAFRDELQPASLTVCPLMNFPELMSHAYLQDGMPTKKWVQLVCTLFEVLPNSMEKLRSLFDKEFHELQPIERIPAFVRHLKFAVKFDDL